MAPTSEPLARPYRVIAHFEDPHELRVALGELGIRLGGHHVVVDPGGRCIEVEVADEPGIAEAVAEVLWAHACDVRLLDFEAHELA
jgi:hypothetical protein